MGKAEIVEEANQIRAVVSDKTLGRFNEDQREDVMIKFDKELIVKALVPGIIIGTIIAIVVLNIH